MFQTKLVGVLNMIKMMPFDLIYEEQGKNFQWCLHCWPCNCV